MSPITADGGVVELTLEEGRKMLDERTRKELGMTLEQFEAAPTQARSTCTGRT
jgi:hypothetical protein